MENEDRKKLKQIVTSMPRDNNKELEIHGGVGEMGVKVVKMVQWKKKCKSYFNRYFKTSSIILMPSDRDMIMNTLSSICSDTKGRGFVFKNYNIVKHLEFLGYTKAALKVNLGETPTTKNNSYIAYVEQKNAILICEKVSNSSHIYQCLKNIVVMVKYFLTLYNMKIQSSGVTIIGLLITENEKQKDLVKCSFCHLFSPSYKYFESPTAFKEYWNFIETYEGWWNLANHKQQNNLFDDLAGEILCFMALQENGLPTLTDDKSQQFKQTYFLYTPRQLDVHLSDAKHLLIQGSYGSGKSILGLKKLELIWKSLRQNEKIIYINFDRSSNLHFLMEKNVIEYVGISSRKIKRTSAIQDIIKSPKQLVYVCHNSAGGNLSAILQEAIRLNMSTSVMVKTKSHLVVEEYDGETLSHDEAAKITKLVKSGDLLESNIILLAQPIMKNRRGSIGKKSYESETCMFNELKNAFKIVKLEEVLRCSNAICGITKCTQNFVRNKNSVFKTKMDHLTLGKQQQPKRNKKHMFSPSLSQKYYPNLETAVNGKVSNQGNNSCKVDVGRGRRMDLDQAFKRSASTRNSKTGKNKIVSKFDFLCEPRLGVEIEGTTPNLVEFSEDINLSSDIAVISLALVLRNFIGKNQTTTVLHMSDEQPSILKRTIQLLPRVLDENFSCTQDIRVYLQKNKQSKMVFFSNFFSVNGMEFDHVIIVVSQSEYYLKYYLPQAISRCTYDLTLILLPDDKMIVKSGSLKNLSNYFAKIRDNKTKETVANMMEELMREYLMNHVVVAKCIVCEKNCYCYSVSNETHTKQKFVVHTHSDQYKDYSYRLATFTESEEPPLGNSVSVANAK